MTSRERRTLKKLGQLHQKHPPGALQSADSLIKQGSAAWHAGKVAAAFDLLRAATTLEPWNIEAAKTLGYALLTTGDLPAGFKEYDRIWLQPDHPLNWKGQPLHGETLFIQTDRTGFGDAIQYARYGELCNQRGARVVMQVAPGLERLLSSVPGVSEVFSGFHFQMPSSYYRAQLVRLPIIFETTLATIPGAAYLTGNPEPWVDFISSLRGFKVGLCWAGKHGGSLAYNVLDEVRSMRLADMTPLLAVPGCSFVSLQLGPPAAQLANLPPGLVYDVSDRLTDWQDTANLVAGLDLVVTVDSAVAHLAGALGKPVWLLNRHLTDWRWLQERSDNPWYPSMRIFRQKSPGDWTVPVAECAQALSGLLDNLRYVCVGGW